jgi:hypothetical protein
VTLEEELSELAVSAEEAATFYEGKPGLVGPNAIIDLYRVTARLAKLMSEIERRSAAE